MKHNPYAAPTALLGGPTGLERDAATVERRAHLGVERSLQSVGNVLVFVGGVSLLYMMLGLAMAGIRVVDTLGASEGQDPQNLALVVLFLIGCGLLGAVQLWVGLGLRHRRPAVRKPATVCAVLALLAFPLGTLLGLRLLWSLWSRKGRRVFADDYAELVAATPHVVHRSSRLLIGVLVVLVAIVAAGMLAALLL